CTAHPCTTFQTPDNNSIAIVIELSRSAPLQSTKERDRKRTLVDDLQSFFTLGKICSRTDRCHHQIVSRRRRLLAGKMPKATTSMSLVDTRARSNTYPRAAG